MKSELQITVDALYSNCLYSSIANAVSNVRYPLFAYEQAWDGNKYFFQYAASKGVISFDLQRKILSGAVCNERSGRINWYPRSNAIALFDSASKEVKTLANSSFEYLYDTIDGVTLPVATTAFWTEGPRIVIYDTWEDFLENGGEYISYIIQPLQELREYWTERNSLLPKEAELLDHLYQLKIQEHLELHREDVAVIDQEAAGYKEFLDSMKEIGFIVDGIDIGNTGDVGSSEAAKQTSFLKRLASKRKE